MGNVHVRTHKLRSILQTTSPLDTATALRDLRGALNTVVLHAVQMPGLKQGDKRDGSIASMAGGGVPAADRTQQDLDLSPTVW